MLLQRLIAICTILQLVISVPINSPYQRIADVSVKITPVIDNEFPLHRVAEEVAATGNLPSEAEGQEHRLFDLIEAEQRLAYYEAVEALLDLQSQDPQDVSVHQPSMVDQTQNLQRPDNTPPIAEMLEDSRKRDDQPKDSTTDLVLPRSDGEEEAEKQRRQRMEKQQYIQRSLAHVLEMSKWLEDTN